MSTPNFHSQKNFGLFVQTFEPISIEEYQKEYFVDDEQNFLEYEATKDDYWKNRILEKSYNDTMEFWADIFWTDIYEGCDGFKDIMENFNDDLIFHTVTFKSGYYDGIQLYVEEKENPYELDNDDCNYYFDMCRSKSIRKYDAEIRKINKWMEKVATQYGWKELYCVGIFSNGEAIYEWAK